jgi:hypothetical protein
MEGPSNAARRHLPVEGLGDLDGLRIRLDDAAKCRPLPVDLADPAEIGLGDLTGGPPTRDQSGVKVGDGYFLQLE